MNQNGDGSSGIKNSIEGQEIEFPVTFNLKAVMLGTENDDDNKQKLVNVFKKLKIDYKYLDKKVSSKGAYASFTYNVTVINKMQMNALYADLKLIKELKFAV